LASAPPPPVEWCGGELIFPERLLPEERAAALSLLRPCAAEAQALLDELSARLESNSVRTTAIAYLRGMITRACAGTFVPDAGRLVAASRRRRQEEAAQRRQRAAEDERLAAERASPHYSAKIAARRAEIRQWLACRRTGGRQEDGA